MFVGLHLYVLPMFLAGLEGQPVDVFKYFEDTGVDGYNLIASIGAFVLVLGILLELGNAAYSCNNGLPARGHDPWGGATLEWFALSPPPPHNFDAVPDVRSAEPLRDIRESVAAPRPRRSPRRRSSWSRPEQPRPRLAERGERRRRQRLGSLKRDGAQSPPVAMRTSCARAFAASSP